MARKEESLTGNFDWLTVLIYVILVLIGWATIYSAVYSEDHSNIFDTTRNSGKQFQWMVVCAIVAGILLIIDGKFFSTFAYVIYATVLLACVGVMFFGVVVKGQQNWIRIGSFQMQPSELAKFATALALAKYLSNLNVDVRKWKDKLIAFAIIVVPMATIVIQGDAGSAIVFVALVLALFREGLEPYFLVIGGTVAILSLLALVVDKFVLTAALFALALLFIWINWRMRRYILYILAFWIIASGYIFSVDYGFSKLKDHQKDRINVLLGKENDPAKNWNVRQSIIAVGSGRILGKGYLNGTQTKLNFVPEQSTDFIFSSIGEEFGFAGSMVLIGLFVVLLFRLIFLAERQRSKFSRVYGYCVISILFFHLVINVGMAIGIAPVIGIPLPFISYGGSSLLSFTILLFIFIRLDAQRLEVLR
jgi:rod shape determining protein RodA